LVIGSHFLTRLPWTTILPFYALGHGWDDSHMPPCLAFFHWDEGLTNVFVQVVLPISASHIAWNDRSNPTPSCYWDGVSETFCPSWLWTTNLPISASQVSRITGMSHQHLASLESLMRSQPSFSLHLRFPVSRNVR
jgi:hypothetical protein